jgi:hypothetical protein
MKLNRFQKNQILEMLKTACELDNVYLVKAIIKEYPEVDPNFKHVLEYTLTQWNNTEVIKYCLQENKIDPSYNDNALIRMVSANGNLELVKILVKDKRVDVSARENDAILDALSMEYFEVAKELFKHLKKPLRMQDVDFFLDMLPLDILELIEEHLKLDGENEQKKIKLSDLSN